MMARVIGGDQIGFNALLYQQPDEKLLNYLQGTIDTASQQLGNVGNFFVNTAQNLYNKYNSSAVINAGKALVSRLDNHLNPDVIMEYNENNIFNATPKMQQYIMVQPELFELDRSQSCNSFDGTYYNVDSKVTTYEEHVRYKEVMDGMLVFDNDTDDAHFVTYSDSEMEDLHVIDQLAIQNTWDVVANLIANDIDPSSLDGSDL